MMRLDKKSYPIILMKVIAINQYLTEYMLDPVNGGALSRPLMIYETHLNAERQSSKLQVEKNKPIRILLAATGLYLSPELYCYLMTGML